MKMLSPALSMDSRNELNVLVGGAKGPLDRCNYCSEGGAEK
jgi:hypothetical protein